MNVLVRSSLSLVLGAALSGGLARAQTTIETVSSWNGTDGFTSFGVPETVFFGQTLTVPAADAGLVSYTFRINQTTADDTLYTTSVYAWDTVDRRATGSALFSTTGTLTTSGVYQSILTTLPGGGLTLSPGQVIVLMFAATGTDPDPGSSAADFGLVDDTAYTGGSAYALASGGGANSPTVNTWGGVGGDFAFSATFAFVPEPSTYAAAGFLAGVVLWRLRRRDS